MRRALLAQAALAAGALIAAPSRALGPAERVMEIERAPFAPRLSRTLGDKYRPHQGKQEVARRKRQIERGQLRQQNGLSIEAQA